MLPMSLGASSPDGVLTQNVQAGAALPMTAKRYREMALKYGQEAADAEAAEPDLASAQEYLRKRSQGGDVAMLNALAAQFAGERFQPMQAQFLKRAAAAQEPLRIGTGMLTPDGQYVRDTVADAQRKAAAKSRQAQAYEQMATGLESAEQRRLDAINRARQSDEFQRMGLDLRQQGIDLQRAVAANRQQGGPQRAPQGYQWTTTADGQPALTFIPGGPADPANKNAGAPSEDERKAASWLAQADNARKNMEAVIKTAPTAAYPTAAERAAGFIPGVGADIANSLRPENRQKFVQAAESMSEALLRAATGAGVTKDETNQKLRELVPQLGDKPGTVQQKLAAYDVYMNALKTRAGRALPTNAAPSGNVIDFNSLPK